MPDSKDPVSQNADPASTEKPVSADGLQMENSASDSAERQEIAALVHASRDGDLVAFEQLIERYQKAIFNVAYYKSRNAFDAEDLSQDIFLAAYQALPSLKDPENFGGWLMGIAHNRCHKWFRREKTKILKFKELGQMKDQNERLRQKAIKDDPEEPLHLTQELEKLPKEISKVLVLKYLEGLSYEAIQLRLGLKSHRIDYLIRKGKSLLKQKMLRRESQ